ncbi:hypothetical protein [Thermocatellispora tengchongensis]|uniref:hypothetical protein n=1 Tax=Thermocatellispora tengchongensis TaxID=1073253 RepID=UPI003628758B
MALAAGAAISTPSWAAVPSSAMATQNEDRTYFLKPGQRLEPGESVRSGNGKYRLIMQTDGNLVLYQTGGGALWSSQTLGGGAFAAMQDDGNLVLYKGRTPLWASNTDVPGAYLAVQDDGNLVIYKGGKVLWHRGARIGTLEPGQRLKTHEYVRSANGDYQLVMQDDGNLVLYRAGKALWASWTKAPGAYAMMQEDGNFVIFNGKTPVWNTKTHKHPGARLRCRMTEMS